MAIYIEGKKKIKNIFANVNGEKKSISSAWVNKDGVPTKVFQLNKINDEKADPYDVAPANEYNDWDYTLDNENNIITLNFYKGSKTDVIVYANYVIGGKTYKTKILSRPSGYVPQYMFSGKYTIKTIKFSKDIDTSDMTDMSHMFESCQGLESLDISSFNTSNVINMSSMFNYCSELTNLDLSSFDTSNFININKMFGGCINLTNLDLSSFDTSNVTNMSDMFNSCIGLTSLDLSSFDTSNVINMNNMFRGCTNLNTIYVTNGKWSTSQATTTYMFKGCGTSTVTYK